MASVTPTLIDAIKTYLETNLPALLAAQSVPEIQKFYRHDPGELRPEMAPQLWVMQVHDAFDQRQGQGTTTKQAAHGRLVVIQVTSSGADGDTASRNLETYCDQIRVCMEQPAAQVLGGAWELMWKETTVSPNGAAGSEDSNIQLFQAAAIAFIVKTISTRGVD